MASSKRLTKDEKAEINRKNAQKSTGPKTEQGKDASRKNSSKHGCRAAAIPPPDEDPGLEQRRIAEWTAEYKPFTPGPTPSSPPPPAPASRPSAPTATTSGC